MRSHGLPSYPDPQFSIGADGLQVRISPGSLNPSAPAFKSADHACHQLLSSAGSPHGSGASGAHEHAHGLEFAACMRSHGVPNFPDPDHDGAFALSSEINQQAPQFQRAMRACMNVRPSSLLLNQVSGGA
jgi:hypothetical protein